MTKFDMRSNPPYQVDWQNASSGKRVSATKRRVRWRFGFSDKQSIAEGKSGIDCRGEEHEVSLVWSLTSGKRLVVADGQEVHFSYGKRMDPKFETTWTMKGGHMIKLIAHAAPPLFDTPGFRQFDLLLDGCSFFEMPKIYELGTRKANKLALATTAPRRGGDAYNNYAFSMPPSSTTRSHPVSPASSDYSSGSGGEYGDSGRSTHSAPTQVEPESNTTRRRESEPVVDFLSAVTPGQDLLLEGSSPVPVQQQQQQQQTPAQQDEFAPVEARAEPPTFQSVRNQIMSQYAPAPGTTGVAPLTLANESHTHYVHPQTPVQQQQQQQPYQPQQQQTYYPQQQVAYQQPTPQQQQPYGQAYHQPQPSQLVTPQQSPNMSESSADSTETTEREQPPSSPPPTVVAPSMAPLSLAELDAHDKPAVSEMERAFQALVNLEDIAEEAVTPEQLKQQEKKMHNKPKRSEPLPPTAPEWHLGRNAKLGDIKEHGPPKTAPAKEIMRTHAFDPAAVQAGMMVVYGATTTSMPQATGFGYAAAQQYQQAYHQQQPVYAAY